MRHENHLGGIIENISSFNKHADKMPKKLLIRQTHVEASSVSGLQVNAQHKTWQLSLTCDMPQHAGTLSTNVR